MQINTKISSIFLICAIIMLVLLFACNYGTKDSYDVNTTWFTNPPGYRTNDLIFAQKETPFTIILPTYIPNDLRPHPFIEGRLKSNFQDDLPVRIMYNRSGESHTPIYIEEYNLSITMLSSTSNNSTFLEISGVEVLEQEIDKMTFSASGTTFVPSFVYTWNKENVHFNVTIYEYTRNEAINIVESMITQIK